MRRDSVPYTLLVATVLCVVCSVLVASAAVGLRSKQESNKLLDQKKNVLVAAGLYKEGENSPAEIEEMFAERIESVLLELDSGEPVGSDVVDPSKYNQRDAARDPQMNAPVEPTSALGGIKQRAKYAFAYQVKDETGKLDEVVLPIHGKGLWSTLYGFISIDADGNTVRGITFYEHGETPGLGGEIENPQWTALWPGKQLHSKKDWDKIALHVIKGSVPPDDPMAKFEVDGLSGATITSNGVTKLVQYWMGPEGFGPYLEKLTAQTGE
ncbi:Na(+)-translocating NADH-quinone reductase subunit C [Bythopirellula polymerisocia]|uniref:Na(+)-translocating NADH-quinone reductase subunit C n=1 Tax=Bythopirellula polymerisocia TaxID=2528003 RepID=A0A5C6C888_9BACT|nr:Na(+)-translocating NADH-quinone reductase subunit C [Bythopirellula polymerisocia]TWU20883.1 Na(+)-translocating NADH-quinone reductase subunit C [Bythopirellula polymerisocia]